MVRGGTNSRTLTCTTTAAAAAAATSSNNTTTTGKRNPNRSIPRAKQATLRLPTPRCSHSHNHGHRGDVRVPPPFAEVSIDLLPPGRAPGPGKGPQFGKAGPCFAASVKNARAKPNVHAAWASVTAQTTNDANARVRGTSHAACRHTAESPGAGVRAEAEGGGKRGWGSG